MYFHLVIGDLGSGEGERSYPAEAVFNPLPLRERVGCERSERTG
jgi:hypothetical protein